MDVPGIDPAEPYRFAVFVLEDSYLEQYAILCTDMFVNFFLRPTLKYIQIYSINFICNFPFLTARKFIDINGSIRDIVLHTMRKWLPVWRQLRFDDVFKKGL